MHDPSHLSQIKSDIGFLYQAFLCQRLFLIFVLFIVKYKSNIYNNIYSQYLLESWDRCILNFQSMSFLKRKQTKISILSLLRLNKVQVQ